VLHDLTFMGDVSFWEKAVRTACVYFGILLLLRLAGKRALAQVTAFDLVVLLLLSNVVQNAIIGPDNSLTGGLVGAAILVVGNFLVVRLTYMHPRLTRLLQGDESVLVEHGRIEQRALRRQLITVAEVNAALRRQGIAGVDAVERVSIEPEGTFTAVPKPQPTTADILEALERIERKLA
jgi:uncharacterized membrane protein YcaP (DUF421 family)